MGFSSDLGSELPVTGGSKLAGLLTVRKMAEAILIKSPKLC